METDDFRIWRLLDEFEEMDAAYLMLDILPGSKIDGIKAKQIEQISKGIRLKLTPCRDESKVRTVESPYIGGSQYIEERIPGKKYYSKEGLIKLAEQLGLRPKFIYWDDLAESTENSASQWPWGNYETELLKALKATAREFWADYDPSAPHLAPTGEVIELWLVKDYGVRSPTAAKSIAQILKADGLPPGPRPKRGKAKK